MPLRSIILSKKIGLLALLRISPKDNGKRLKIEILPAKVSFMPFARSICEEPVIINLLSSLFSLSAKYFSGSKSSGIFWISSSIIRGSLVL